MHQDLKKACRYNNLTITEFAASLIKPDGTKGVTHAAVIQTAQGKDNIKWIRDEIEKFIEETKQRYPEIYNSKKEANLNGR